MQLLDMVARVRKTLGEPEENGFGSQLPGDGSWDNSQIIGYINEACGIMAHAWRKEKVGNIAIASVGQTDFSLPADALEDGLRAVSYLTNGTAYPMDYIDLDSYNRYSTGQSPAYAGMQVKYMYTVWAGTIKVWPGVAATTDSLQTYYYRLPNALANATDTSELPLRFHTAPVFYAIKECQNAVEEINLEGDAAQKWNTELARFRMEMSKNQRDKGIRMRGRR